METFRVLVNGERVFRITTGDAFGDGEQLTADCRDIRTGYESQSIVEASAAATPAQLLTDPQTRDAIKSAYLNATSYEAGTYPTGGTSLPQDFALEIL